MNSSENQLTLQNVRSHFGKLWTLFSDSKIMAQPLYVSKLIVPAADAVSAAAKAQCPAGCNVVIFGSMKGTVYAYLADQKPTTQSDTLVWAQFLGPPRNGGGDIDMWATDTLGGEFSARRSSTSSRGRSRWTPMRHRIAPCGK